MWKNRKIFYICIYIYLILQCIYVKNNNTFLSLKKKKSIKKIQNKEWFALIKVKTKLFVSTH